MRTDRPRPTTEHAEARLLADIAAVQSDTIDPNSVRTKPRRAAEMPECGPSAQNIVDCLRAIYDITGEEPERFDEFTGPMGGGL